MYSSTPLDAGSVSPACCAAAAVNVAPDVPGGPLGLVLPFATLAGGFNLASVDGVVRVLDRAVANVTNNAFDIDSFALVSTVPENPTAALALAGRGAVALVSRRRRSHREAASWKSTEGRGGLKSPRLASWPDAGARAARTGGAAT